MYIYHKTYCIYNIVMEDWSHWDAFFICVVSADIFVLG